MLELTLSLNNVGDPDKLEIVSRSCNRMRRLTIRSDANRLLSKVSCLFWVNMPFLTSLSLDISGDSGDLSEVMLKLSKLCGALVEFRLKGSSQDRTSFEAFARNATML